MDMNPEPTDLQMRAGRVRLEMLLETVTPAPSFTVCDTTGDLEAVRPWLRRDNLDAICVLARPDGRWSISVFLRRSAPGIRKSFGSPPGQPFETAQEAEQAAAGLLAMVLQVEQLTAASPAVPIPVFPAEEAFFLHGFAVPLMKTQIAAQRAFFREQGFLDRKDARNLARLSLEAMMRGLFPDGFQSETLLTLPRQKAEHMAKVLHGAACLGIWSHPPVSDRQATREEHLTWSKQRALEHVDLGELRQALDRFEADLLTHPDTARSRAPDAAAKLLAQGQLRTPGEVRSFIESVL